MTDTPLWQPSPDQAAATAMAALMKDVGAGDYAALHRWSVAEPEAFWTRVWDLGGVIGTRGDAVLADGDKMPGARFFPQARLNFAENLLKRRDDTPALLFRGEDKVRAALTWAELYDQVSQTAQALKALGIKPGDRVAAMMPNMPQTIIAMLASASLGAIWSSCSPDFGEQGVVDRFGQIEPRVFFACDGYYYNGKRLPVADKVRAVTARLPSVEQVVIVPYIEDAAAAAQPKAVAFPDFIAPYAPDEIAFAHLPFAHPLYILFSSGTTGVPKCIVHSAGGTLLQHLKEHKLHCDLKPGERLFYFTTCGWMMWNWLVSGLAAEATLALYDGSPFYPSGNVLFDYADEERIDVFGTSAKFIDALRKAELRPRESHDLSSVRLILSTGSPLVPESFDYVYDAVKDDVCLSSISGGTDIVSCFVLGNPAGPVYRGEIQALGLGMKVEVWDGSGHPVVGEKGELVCTAPFPSMPVGFWNDPDGARYRAAYFESYPGVWCHGDFAEITRHGGVIIHGRSDATLNPGGVRIGTAEIYRQVEQLDEVVEALAVGQAWDNDVRVVLFVVLRGGVALDDGLVREIKARIRSGASPRHVPAKVIAVPDIPRTKSGKITELAVRDIIHGREIGNREALANPDALEHFRDLEELQS